MEKITETQWFNSIKPYLMIGINAFLFISMPIYGYNLFGLWGFLLGILLFAVIKMILMRKFFMMVVRNIETQVFGKPLDKDYWQKGEFKFPKINWRFKKNGKEKEKEQ